MRLTPPPKVTPTGDRQQGTPSAGGGLSGKKRRGAGFWLTLVAFTTLAVVAFGVFVLLPGWVPEFDVTSDASESTPLPIENPATPNQDTSSAEPPPEPEPEPPAEPGPVPQAHSAPASPPPARSIERPLASTASTGDGGQAAFASAMAEGLARLDGGELEEAREAFESARALRPSSAEAADGLARVESAAQLIAIAEHRGSSSQTSILPSTRR